MILWHNCDVQQVVQPAAMYSRLSNLLNYPIGNSGLSEPFRSSATAGLYDSNLLKRSQPGVLNPQSFQVHYSRLDNLLYKRLTGRETL
jgi:hypothetical protein